MSYETCRALAVALWYAKAGYGDAGVERTMDSLLDDVLRKAGLSLQPRHRRYVIALLPDLLP